MFIKILNLGDTNFNGSTFSKLESNMIYQIILFFYYLYIIIKLHKGKINHFMTELIVLRESTLNDSES